MEYFTLSDLPEREPVPGFRGRFVHTDALTLAYWDIEANAALPEHSHPHQQVVNVLEGELELVVAGTPYRLGPGQVYTIPGEMPHAARALTACRVLDVFSPAREDYR